MVSARFRLTLAIAKPPTLRRCYGNSIRASAGCWNCSVTRAA